MKKILFLVVLTIGVAFAPPALPLPLRQKWDGATATDGWLKSGGNLFNQNYSPLAQINRQSVAGLKAGWRARLGGSGRNSNDSREPQPVIHEGGVYIVTG